MTPRQIIEIYRALRELEDVVFPYKQAREIAGLCKRVNEEFELIVQQENKLAAKYNGKRDGHKRLVFDNAEHSEAFAVEYNEMLDGEIDVDLQRVDLSKYADRLQLSPRSLSALERVINFGGVENG